MNLMEEEIIRSREGIFLVQKRSSDLMKVKYQRWPKRSSVIVKYHKTDDETSNLVMEKF